MNRKRLQRGGAIAAAMLMAAIGPGVAGAVSITFERTPADSALEVYLRFSGDGGTTWTWLEVPGTVEWVSGEEYVVEAMEFGTHYWDDRHRAIYSRWTDGAPRVRTIAVPAQPTTYTVQYEHLWNVYLYVEPYRIAVPELPEGVLQWGSGEWYVDGTVVVLQAEPDLGWRFDHWSWWGPDPGESTENPLTLVIDRSYVLTLHYEREIWDLETAHRGHGAVTPAPGPQLGGDTVWTHAQPDPGHRFVQWVGSGEGSYSGAENPVPVLMAQDGVRQVAVFEPVDYELTLSLSETDPGVHRGQVTGVTPVHLWLACGTGGHPFSEIEVALEGSLDILAFDVAPGFFSSGVDPVLIAPAGPVNSAPARLGRFLVAAPDEGGLCLDEAAGTPLTVKDLRGAVYEWPHDVKFTGVRTDGGAPCRSGHGCRREPGVSLELAVSSALPLPRTSLAMSDGLRSFAARFASGQATIDFELGAPQPVRVSVHDVAGRVVRVLRSGTASAGANRVAWDGRDSGGRRAAAGVYFVRLQTPQDSATRKLVRVDR